MELIKSTWIEIESYLAACSAVIIPIGSTEQHGPTGMIGTDSLCAEAIAKQVGENLGLCVAPCLSVGMAEHHLAFAGTMSLRPETLVAVIKDVILSLACHGFKDFAFINGHGGNVACLKKAFGEVQNENSTLRCQYWNWYQGEEIERLRQNAFGDREGRHATPSEIALVQHLDAETIRPADDFADLAPSHSYDGAKDMREKHPDGRIGGDVSLANPQIGQELFHASVTGLCRELKAFLS